MTQDTRAPLGDGRYDAIVVGARVAGAATAMLLARAGWRTLLIDRCAPNADTLSTHAVTYAGVQQLHRWGLLDHIAAAGTPPVRHTWFGYGGAPVRVDIRASDGVDALYAPRRTVLDPLLARSAAEAGCAVHHHTAVTGLLRSAGRVRGVTATAIDGRHVTLHAPIVIGADGLRSTIARLVAAPYTRVATSAAAVSYGYWPDLELDGFRWNFVRHACSGAIPTNGGMTCVFASAPAAVIGAGGVDVIAAAVGRADPELAERLRTGARPAGTRQFQGHPGYVRRSHGPGWALVGDAGCFKDPIGAHGITDALRDAELLAQCLIRGASLAEYEATRDRAGAELFEVVDRIAGHRWDAAEVETLVRRMLRAIDRAPVTTPV